MDACNPAGHAWSRDPDERLIEEGIVADIRKHGWQAICIEARADAPAFVYSVGLMHTFSHPEIIGFGLPTDDMHRILCAIVREIRGGRSFAVEGLYEGILEKYPIAIRAVHVSQLSIYLGYAMWHCRHTGAPGGLAAVQCIWPDRNGLFTWEEHCHPDVVKQQPRLDVRSMGRMPRDGSAW